jgi:hypothetical protein
MRKIRAALVIASVATAMGALLAGPAQAAVPGENCDRLYGLYQNDGYFRAYDAIDCDELLGASQGNDSNWNDNSGNFRSPSNDKATSLLNTGTYAGGVNTVTVFSDAGYEGFHGCVTRAELYVDDLRDNNLYTANGVPTPANNKVSSHEWTSYCVNRLT